ncbi:benzoate 1,2-dioxygenase electron transfer component BenC [Nakamurella sp.]|uniref:benzoate 1,2-dioxygenase electron transfer component BenC n=1 Tax=Nakamurella sp. TaxID=1869182 RepID=UPI0037834965
MTYQIALNFEDGVTRFIECRSNEVVADASYRQRINIPLDCRDGACGTCKSFCESGSYDGGDYIEEAMTDDEAAAGYVLTCQMVPESDCIIRIPATSDVAKTSLSTFKGTLSAIERLSDTAIGFSIALENRGLLGFLPGQYVNIQVPGTDQARSFSFSSGPSADEAGFLIRNTTHGVLTTYLRDRAKVGDAIEFNGPLGSFYLREIKRPALFLAGGTGLAPFLSMLHKIEAAGSDHPIHLIFGVTNDVDLVRLDELEGYAQRIPNFTYTCCVAAEDSSYPNKGYVTRYITPAHLNSGVVDIYLCGPPPMVDAVRTFLSDEGITPASFYYEKFAGSGVVSEIGESHVKVVDSDEAFDARMALELGAAQLVIGKLSEDQLVEFRGLASATGEFIKEGRFVDAAGFRDANSKFHLFTIEATGNKTLADAYRTLLVQEYMGQVLTPSVDLVGDITQDHINMVEAFAQNDIDGLRTIIVEHNDHAKATMRAGIEKSGSKV